MNKIVTRSGITPVGSSRYRVNRLRFHLLSYCIARQAFLIKGAGSYIIRCDDTNTSISEKDYFNSYLNTLEFIGIKPDISPNNSYSKIGTSLLQSERFSFYKEACEKLKEKDLIIESTNGALLFNCDKFIEQYSHLVINNIYLEVEDAARGKMLANIKHHCTDSRSLLPFPITRSNGTFLFNLCSPVDDALLNVTHVVRDIGKLNVLAQQEMIRIALDYPKVTYVHVGHLVDHNSKRFISHNILHDATFESFMEAGFTKSGILSYLLSTLTKSADNLFFHNLDDFSIQLSLDKVNVNNVHFNYSSLLLHNKNALKNIDFSEYKDSISYFSNIAKVSIKETDIKDTYLINLLYRTKQPVDLIPEIVNYIKYPIYSNIENEILVNSLRIVDLILELKIMNDDDIYNFVKVGFNDHLDFNSEFTKKDFWLSLRYILTGKLIGIDIGVIVEYLMYTKQLSDRVVDFFKIFNNEKK